MMQIRKYSLIPIKLTKFKELPRVDNMLSFFRI